MHSRWNSARQRRSSRGRLARGVLLIVDADKGTSSAKTSASIPWTLSRSSDKGQGADCCGSVGLNKEGGRAGVLQVLLRLPARASDVHPGLDCLGVSTPRHVQVRSLRPLLEREGPGAARADQLAAAFRSRYRVCGLRCWRKPQVHDPNLHLFVDDAEIHNFHGLLRKVNRPRKHPEPVIVADRPWEVGNRVQAWGSVVKDPDGLLRIWYFALNADREPGTEQDGGYCYAESRDGIHWEKPALGVVDWRGSTDNNLFFTFSRDGRNLIEEELARRGTGLPAMDAEGNQIGVVNNMDGLTVFRDETDPDLQRRYKLIANMQDHRMWAPHYRDRYPNVTDEDVANAHRVFGQYMVTSPDGIHWTREPRMLVKAEAGDYMMVMRDDRNNRFWLNERSRGCRGRNAGFRYSEDLMKWTDPVEAVFFNGPDGDYGRLWEWHGGITPFNYGTMDLGLLEHWCNSDFGDGCELVSHRDGQPWQRVSPGTLFLDTGGEGSFDRVLAYPTHNPPIQMGDKLFIFYSGAPARPAPEAALPFSIGLITIGLDRFAGLVHTRGEAGYVLTKPLRVPSSVLEVNAETTLGKGVKVAVCTPDLSEIPGYGLELCEPLPMDAIRVPVRWKQRKDIAELVGREVVLRFSVQGACLYGYRFGSGGEGR